MAGSFSFDTPEEVMHVLASIRSSSITSDQKSALRDLVLSYTNGGKDPSLKIQIEQQLGSLGIAPSQTPTSLTAADPLDFGSSRNVPSFNASAATAAPVKTVQNAAPVSPAPAPVAQQQAAPLPVTPPVAPAPQPVAAAPAPVAAPPVVPVAPQPVAAAPAPVSAVPPAAPVPVPATPPAAPTTVPTGDDHLRRIREIKAMVNEKVGNPVNLVDIDNTVGRDYMSALLGAMKGLNGGGDMQSAMAKLETAYISVEEILKNQPKSTAAPAAEEPAVVTQESTPAPVSDENARSIPIQSAGQKTATNENDDSEARWANTEIRVPDSVSPIKRPEPVKIPPRPAAPVSPVVPPPPPTPPAPAPEVKSAETFVPIKKAVAPVVPEKPMVAPPKPVAPAPAPVSVPEERPAPAPEVKPEPPAPADLPVEPQPPVKPLSATGAPLKSVSDLPTADSLETSKTGDPLFTKEVDDGLNQLLCDWVLFKKSGLLGTGPKGMNHPLYLKIKELQIPILLAGRFDGATQEIKQSITDYMNGWRYEQGIIYEQGETFDHYLRRVIRHILDLQK